MPASPALTPPPPPPDNVIGPAVSPPPPPPPPEDTNDIPPPPTSEPEEPTKSLDQPANDTAAIEAEPKPRRRRRFSPTAQDPPKPSQGHASLSTPYPQQGHSKAPTSSTSSTTSRDSGSRTSTSTSSISANQWEKTSFVDDASGEKRMKFLKLMGLGKSTKIEAKPDNTEEASQEAAKRHQVLRDMERQYETGRKRRHQLN